MKLLLASRSSRWLEKWLGIAEIFARFERLDHDWDAALVLEEEGTLTPARLGHIQFRQSRLNSQADHIVERLKKVTTLCNYIFVFCVGYEILTRRLIIALFHLVWWLVTSVATRLWIARQIKEHSEFTSSPAPAGQAMRRAEFLLWILLPREGREAAIGDTNEKFEIITEKFGPRRAQLWYWGEVARSVWPLLSYLGERLWKWTFFGSALEWLRRHI